MLLFAHPHSSWPKYPGDLTDCRAILVDELEHLDQEDGVQRLGSQRQRWGTACNAPDRQLQRATGRSCSAHVAEGDVGQEMNAAGAVDGVGD